MVAPKRERLAEAEAKVAAMVSLLEAKRGQLRDLEEKLEVLQRRFSLSCREKENLEAEQRLCALKLLRARKLISEFTFSSYLYLFYKQLMGDGMIFSRQIFFFTLNTHANMPRAAKQQIWNN